MTKENSPRICCCIFPNCSDTECKVFQELKAKEIQEKQDSEKHAQKSI